MHLNGIMDRISATHCTNNLFGKKITEKENNFSCKVEKKPKTKAGKAIFFKLSRQTKVFIAIL